MLARFSSEGVFERRGLPRGLIEVVERAMRKHPADRFQTMAKLEHELHAFAEEPSRRGVQSKRATAPEEPPKRRQKFALPALLAGSALALILYMTLRPGEPKPAPNAKPTTAVASPTIAQPESPPAAREPQEPQAVPTIANKPSATAHAHEHGPVHVALKTGVHPEAAPAPAPVNCSPPFYYEGKKKLFKPGCI